MANNANTDVNKLITYGQMALEQGWYDQARKDFEKVLALDPSNREAIEGLAQANKMLSRGETAPIEPPEPPAGTVVEPKQDEPVEPPYKVERKKERNVEVAESETVNLTVQVLKCPMCGGSLKPHDRECAYCGSTVIITSLEKTFSLNTDSQLLTSSISRWREVLKQEPDSPEANYALGLAYLNLKLRDAALQHLRKAALLAPESPIIHYNLALALFGDGNVKLDSQTHEDIIKEIDYAVRLDPQFREAIAFSHFLLARKLDKVDNVGAIREYKAAIQACPDIATFHNNLGFCYCRNKNYSAAEKHYLDAIGINPEYGLAYSNLCLLYYKMGKYKDGIRCGRKAVELTTPTTSTTDQAYTYNRLSLCLWKTGHKDEAVQAIQKATAFWPQNTVFWHNQSIIQGSLLGILNRLSPVAHILDSASTEDMA